jgi:hypothetical protein
MRVWRQNAPGDWDAVVARVTATLQQVIAAR